MAALQMLVLPFIILNIFGVAGGAIWLVILGKWSVLWIGLLSIFLSAPVIAIAQMPGTLISMGAAPFLGGRLWFLGFPFVLAGSLYDYAIVGAWCLIVVTSFVGRAGAGATLPALLWAYGVAISPLSYMTQRSKGPGGPEFVDVLVTFAAQVAIVVMGIMVLAYGLEIRTLVYACAVAMVVAVLVQAMVSFFALRESALKTS
jgi:hypothetical protein